MEYGVLFRKKHKQKIYFMEEKKFVLFIWQ